MTRRQTAGMLLAAGACFGVAHAGGAMLVDPPRGPVRSENAAPAAAQRSLTALGPAQRLPVLRPPPVPRTRSAPAARTRALRGTPAVARAATARPSRQVSPSLVRTQPVRRTPIAPPAAVPVAPEAAAPQVAAPQVAQEPAPLTPSAEAERVVVFFDDGG